MLRLSTQVVTVWLLRIMGFMICMAVGPIFFPRSWMEAIAVGLGLGEPPALPLFYYLAFMFRYVFRTWLFHSFNEYERDSLPQLCVSDCWFESVFG